MIDRSILVSAISAISCCVLGGGTAQAIDLYEHAVHVAMDTDNDPATGCNWIVADAEGIRRVHGAETLIDIRIDANQSPPQISRIELERCNNGTFDPKFACGPTELAEGSWRLASGVGLSETDRLELALPLEELEPPRSLRIYVSSRSAGGERDALTTVGGTLEGRPILFTGAQVVPGLGEMGGLLTAMLLLIMGLGLLPHPAFRTISLVFLLLIAVRFTSAATAGSNDLFGGITGGEPIAEDPIGDGTGADQHADLRALFVTEQADALFLQIDVANLEASVCRFQDEASSPSCDGVCHFSDEPGSPDCDGVCDELVELPASPDCETDPVVYYKIPALESEQPSPQGAGLLDLMQHYQLQFIPSVNKGLVFRKCDEEQCNKDSGRCTGYCDIEARNSWRNRLQNQLTIEDDEGNRQPLAPHGYISMEWHHDAQDFCCTQDELAGMSDWPEDNGYQLDLAGFIHWHRGQPALEEDGLRSPFTSWIWDSKWRHLEGNWNDPWCDVDRLERGLWKLELWRLENPEPIPRKFHRWALVSLINKSGNRIDPPEAAIRAMADVVQREAEVALIFEDAYGMIKGQEEPDNKPCTTAEIFLDALLGPSGNASPCP